MIPGLDVLNCGMGHLEFNFDKSSPKDVAEAKKVIEDMLRRGYTIIVEHEGETHRVTSFDPEQEVYYVEMPAEPAEPAEPAKSRRGRPKGKPIPIKQSRATGIGRTGGG